MSALPCPWAAISTQRAVISRAASGWSERHATVLLRALGYSTQELLNFFYSTETVYLDKVGKYAKSIEFDLLDVLSANPKVVYNRQQLLDRVWGPGWFGDDHVVDVHIANLRKKIDQPGTKSLVRTVRGVGYSMGG